MDERSQQNVLMPEVHLGNSSIVTLKRSDSNYRGATLACMSFFQPILSLALMERFQESGVCMCQEYRAICEKSSEKILVELQRKMSRRISSVLIDSRFASSRIV